VGEAVELQEQISFEEIVVLPPSFHFRELYFTRRVWKYFFLINSIKEEIVDYKKEFSLSSANLAWAYSI
jgi:hypothetical protein